MKTIFLVGFCLCLALSGFSQNVGIGIINPAFKLDVRDGSINVDSVYRINSITVLATPGVGNLFVGKDAGKINTGDYNTFSGELAGFNTTGSSNSFFGQTAGYDNTTGEHNSFYGRSAGSGNTTGNFNSFFGRSSAYANTTGHYNTALGYSSLTNNSIGAFNTALGYNANLNNTGTLNNATAIGANARVDCSNCLVLGSVNAINGASSGVNVGIGITAPTEKLHVSGNIKSGIIMPEGIMLTPNAGEGKILTSDAQGNASWEESNAGGEGAGYGSWGDCSMNGISEYLPVADDNGDPSDAFGSSLAISDNYAIVGSPYDSAGINANQGSASTFQNSGGNWTLMEEITDATGASNQNFGSSVSISDNYAIVGAFFENAGTGSVSIYQYSGGTWNLMQKLTDSIGTPGENFGYSVSISGNYAIVGAPADDTPNSNQGSVSIYEYANGVWDLMEKIWDASGDTGDFFGKSVSISGNYAIVGAHWDDDISGANQGSASIYQFINGSWELMEKIIDANGGVDEYFGNSVSISGNSAIVGSPYDNIGTNIDQGSASIYKLNGMDWILMQKLTDPGGGANDWFGFSVFMSGIYAIVGAPSDYAPSGTRGSATIYYRVGAGWQKLQYISDPVGTTTDFFGHAVAIDGITKRFIIGAHGYMSYRGKAVFGKIN